MNAQITRDISDDEINEAVKEIDGDRAPGTEGMSATFYHQLWSTIHDKVTEDVPSFFVAGEMPHRLNETHLCLIPKIDPPVQMSDFLPISLCNVSYKFISNILTKRLKSILPSIISLEQTAFVSGQQITGKIFGGSLIIIHSLKSWIIQSKTYMAIKTDISKAYDRVEWEFLEKAMQQLGFDHRWIHWVMTCVRTISYSVLVNGSPYGLRQEERNRNIKGLAI